MNTIKEKALLKDEINLLRRKLDFLLYDGLLNSTCVLKLSEELDALINQYYISTGKHTELVNL